MAPVGHIDKVIFFDPYTIFTCNTSIVTTFGMQNLFLILFSSLEVIFSLKGQDNNVIVQRSSQAFNKVDPDQVMECIHGTGKKSGGSVGITNTISALCRWTLPYNLRLHIHVAAQTHAMYRLCLESVRMTTKQLKLIMSKA